MAWTAPMTFVANTTLTAAQLNTYLRDNLNETPTAKATTEGYHFVATGVNAVAERAIEYHEVTTSQSSTSTSYTNLSTVGPTVTVTTGTRALYWWHTRSQHSASDSAVYSGVEVSGASTIAASDSRALIVDGLPAGNGIQCAGMHLETNLTPGSNTFTVKYRVNAGTGTWGLRHLVVMAL